MSGYKLEKDGIPSLLRRRGGVGKPALLNMSNIYFTGGV